MCSAPGCILSHSSMFRVKICSDGGGMQPGGNSPGLSAEPPHHAPACTNAKPLSYSPSSHRHLLSGAQVCRTVHSRSAFWTEEPDDTFARFACLCGGLRRSLHDEICSIEREETCESGIGFAVVRLTESR